MGIVAVISARPGFVDAGTASASFVKCPRVRATIVYVESYFDRNIFDVFFTKVEMGSLGKELDVRGGTPGEMTKCTLRCTRRKSRWVSVCGVRDGRWTRDGTCFNE
jgi:hypothetical protein